MNLTDPITFDCGCVLTLTAAGAHTDDTRCTQRRAVAAFHSLVGSFLATKEGSKAGPVGDRVSLSIPTGRGRVVSSRL